MNDLYMYKAYEQALKAYKNGDVPVGCVIVKNDKIISKAYNKKEKSNNATYHAELLAISKACKKLKTWHLEDCTLYTTLEPCLMCMGTIIQSRINIVYYSTNNFNFGEIELLKKYNKKIKIEYGIMKNESSNLLKKFFQEKRK